MEGENKRKQRKKRKERKKRKVKKQNKKEEQKRNTAENVVLPPSPPPPPQTPFFSSLSGGLKMTPEKKQTHSLGGLWLRPVATIPREDPPRERTSEKKKPRNYGSLTSPFGPLTLWPPHPSGPHHSGFPPFGLTTFSGLRPSSLGRRACPSRVCPGVLGRCGGSGRNWPKSTFKNWPKSTLAEFEFARNPSVIRASVDFFHASQKLHRHDASGNLTFRSFFTAYPFALLSVYAGSWITRRVTTSGKKTHRNLLMRTQIPKNRTML